jgi:ligand-binding SRPBCC domain-containing protein
VTRLKLVTQIDAPIATAFDFARDIDLHVQSMRNTGERAIAGRTSGLIGLGETVSWRANHFGVRWTLTSRVTAFKPPRCFVDEQVQGPFSSFRHEHLFDPVNGGTVMTDIWEHSVPFGILGELVDRMILARSLASLLAVRAKSIKAASEASVNKNSVRGMSSPT